jgi:hypothetical protein
MQNEIRKAVERDRLFYNTAGFVAGCIIAILFFSPRVVYDRRGRPSAYCHFVGTRDARLARLPP